MSTTRRAFIATAAGTAAGAAAGLSGCASTRTGESARQNGSITSEADRAVIALLDDDLEAQRRANPIGASMRGDKRFDRLLPDLSPAAIAARRDADADRLNRLMRIDRARLSDEQRLNAELLEWELRDGLESAAFAPEQMPISQQSGPHISAPQWPDSLSLVTAEDRSAYVDRLRAFDSYMRQIESHMRDGLASGRTPPRAVMAGVPAQIAAMATAGHRADPSKHPMYKPFLAVGVGESERRAARDAVAQSVLPAFARFERFVREEYVPGCRATLGASAMPDGESYYENRLRHFTTTGMTAREIHDTGLTEVARLRARMFEVIARSDFPERESLTGDALFAAFTGYLRTNERFYHKTAAGLLAEYREIAKRIDGALPRLFRLAPRLSYGVRAMPAFMAASAPTAYYYPGSLKTGVAGFFVANTSSLDQRPRYEMAALTLHEASPGHHFQIALAQELEDAGLHEWRTTLGFTAFVEGWALYAETLGYDLDPDAGPLGLYRNPYDEFGHLSYQMWRALRLVVDTGIHAFGWTRDRAVRYMLDNSALTETNVRSEVDRYIAWPGQATGYMIGRLRIGAMRERAEHALGGRFDQRSFHDAALGAGALPIDILERRIEAWTDAQAR